MNFALEGQLVGKYMRAQHSRYGTLLLTWHGKRKTWTAGNTELNFEQVIKGLCGAVAQIRARNTQIDGLSVVGIDLTRSNEGNKRAKQTAPKKRRRKRGKG